MKATTEKFIKDVKDLVEKCEEITGNEDLPENAHDFAESVSEKLTGMSEWAEKNDHVTPKMQSSIENIERGIDRWLEHS